ncbi:hypothetical protein ALT721_2340020 [Alteromonas alvinellae]
MVQDRNLKNGTVNLGQANRRELDETSSLRYVIELTKFQSLFPLIA